VEHSAIFAGFGGQGLLFCGHVLAEAALYEGRDVTWMPSYGPEMRGGTASCTVVLSDRPIGSPIPDRADSVVALNPPSLAKFESTVAPGGLLVLNSSLIEAETSRSDIEVLSLPCTEIASSAGDVRLVSIVALGGLLALRPVVQRESVERALRTLLAGKGDALIEADLTAFARGVAAARAQPALVEVAR
jgi:2-oxoglutarate ferredoxin oxidoreductase subunit gamma